MPVETPVTSEHVWESLEAMAIAEMPVKRVGQRDVTIAKFSFEGITIGDWMGWGTLGVLGGWERVVLEPEWDWGVRRGMKELV
jgi:hypothetical protein